MVAKLLLNLALTEAETVAATPGLCKRVRYRQSECTECVDTCPEEAITLDMGPRINDACTQCGLCVSVCPTEAIQHGFNLDQQLLDRIKSSVGEAGAVGEPGASKHKKSFYIHCQQSQKQGEDSCRVACLGNITEEFMLGAALSGLDELVLARGECSECRLAAGGTLFQNAITTSRVRQQSLGLNGFVLRLAEKPKAAAKEARLSRRAFFSSITQRVKDQPIPDVQYSAVATANGEPISQFNTRPSPKKESLRRLLRQLNGRSDVSDLNAMSPWRTMLVDEKNCIACGVCVAVCPTGALRKEHENNQLIRYLNHALCTDCSLCEEACPKQVISFAAAGNIASHIEDTNTVVARIDLTACAICGETIPRAEGEVCITCQKRQLSPLFM